MDARAVQIQQNILKLKRDDVSRSLINTNGSAWDMAGGFPWQNRVLVPLLLTAGATVLEAVRPRGTEVALRHTFAALTSGAIFCMYLSIYGATAWMTARAPRRKSSALSPADLGMIAQLLSAFFVTVSTTAPPRLITPNDYLNVAVFCVGLPLLAMKRQLALVALVAVAGLIRESSLFLPVLYWFCHYRPSFCARDGLSRALDVPTWLTTGLLFAVALTTILVTRAYFLGGFAYAFGIAGTSESYFDNAPLCLLSILAPPGVTISTLVFLGALLFGALRSVLGGTRDAGRLVTAGVAITLISLPFVWFWETRAFCHVLPVLIVPCTLALTQGFGQEHALSRATATNGDEGVAAVEGA